MKDAPNFKKKDADDEHIIRMTNMGFALAKKCNYII